MRVVWILAALAAMSWADAAVEGCKVAGRIECAGKGVEGANVVIAPWPEHEEGGRFIARTTADGRYEIADVPSGRATVLVEVGGPAQRMTYFRFVRIPEAKEFSVDLALADGEVIGRVTNASDGSPLPGRTVFAGPVEVRLDQKASGTQATAETDAEGNFRIRFLKPGSYFVSITGAPFGHDALANEVLRPVEVREDRPARADLALRAGGSASVRVVDAEGKPVADAAVFLIPAGGGMPPIPLFPDPRAGDPVARSANLSPASYHAIAVGDGFAWSASETREVRAEAETSFEVKLGRGVPVTLRVVDEDGQAVPSMLLLSFPVFVDAAGHEFLAFPETEAIDSNRLAPGAYTVRFRLEGYRPLSVPLRVGSDPPPPVVLKLEPIEGPR